MTFNDLDLQHGPPSLPENDGGTPPPNEWYDSLRERTLEQLEAGDVARACRLGVHLDEMVPLSFELLEIAVAETGMYDGELLLALLGISPAFWQQRDYLTQQFKLMLQNGRDALPEEVPKIARDFLIKVSR